jgi:putative PIN family toxin of toxin-antitoxin system
VENVLRNGILLFSDFTMDELKSVLFRSKFDRYVSREERALFLAQLSAAAEFVEIIQLVRKCRDPKDDKYLEVALNGRADVIITGDTDLRSLHPWREIQILSPAAYLKRAS